MTLPSDETMHGITKSELKLLILEAAEKGSDLALARIGLHDANAVHDVKELRNLLESWRDTRKSVNSTVVKVITVSILGFIALASWVEIKDRL